MSDPKNPKERYANRVLGRLREILGRMNRASEQESVNAHNNNKRNEMAEVQEKSQIGAQDSHPGKGVHHAFTKDILKLSRQKDHSAPKLTPRKKH